MEQDFWTSLWETVRTVLSHSIVDFILNFILGVIVLIVGIKISKKLVKKFFGTKKMQQRDKSVISFMRSFTTIALYVLVAILFASIVGVPMATISAGVASIGIAIGLALQGSLSNLAGGLMILIFKPFKIGDYVVNNTEEGTVEDISLFYTTLVTIDNKEVVIPNGIMSNSAMTNVSARDTRRLDMEFGIAYSSNIDKAREIVMQCIKNLPDILYEPAPEIPLVRQDASSLVLQARVWCKTDDYWKHFFQLNEQVKNAFDANGIEIPFPQMDVHFNPNVLTKDGK